MSGLEYYDVSGYINSNVALGGAGATKMEEDFDMPTAPMYKDGRTYNGRCAVWLKEVVFEGRSNNNQLRMRTFLNTSSQLGIVLSTPSLNQIPLLVNKGQPFPGPVAFPPNVVGTKIQTSFGGSQPVILKFFPNEGKSLQITNTGGTGGVEAVDYLATTAFVGTTSGNVGTDGYYPAVNTLIPNQPTKLMYVNHNVGDMAYANITGNVWGSSLNISLVRQYLSFAESGVWVDSAGIDNPIYFVLTIKPLTNDPIYNGMPLDDKQRL
jgi:hypothetical protein